MDEPIEVTNKTVTVSFKRKLDLRDYNSAEAFIAVQGDVPSNATGEQIAEVAAALFFPAKTAVYEQLGITYDTTIDGRAMEALETELAAVQVTSRQEAQAIAEATPVTEVRRGPATGAGKTKDYPTLARELVANPEKWFDNRESKKSDAQPDFKRKGTGQGLWLTDKATGELPDYWEGLEVPPAEAFK